MFKPELWQSHDEYRTIVNTYGRRLSRNNPKYSFDLYDKEQQKLLGLNLDAVLKFIPQFYSDGGRPAKNQAQILRSLILFVLLFNQTPAKTSLTTWVRDVLPFYQPLGHKQDYPQEDLSLSNIPHFQSNKKFISSLLNLYKNIQVFAHLGFHISLLFFSHPKASTLYWL